MGIDFGALPPEFTSARIYAGPGSSSLVAASQAWNGVAAELSAAAQSYDNVVTSLASEEWLGPASAAMAEAVQPYVTWMTTTAAQAEQAATQASSAVAAFETVFASVVPPQLIATNRAELTEALQTNILGQNNGVIAALESQYAEFWAQNAGAMYSYAGSSASATQVTQFSDAPQVANPAAATTQAAATTATASTGTAQQTLNQILNYIPTAIQGLASSPITGPIISELQFLGSATGPFSWLWKVVFGTTAFPSNIAALLTAYGPYSSALYYTAGLPNFGIGIGNFMTQTAKTLGFIGGPAQAAAAAVPKGVPGLGGAIGGVGGQVAAGLGNATHIGRLAVPSAWSSALPSAVAHGGAIPVESISAAPESGASGNLLGGMPLAGAGGGRHGLSGPRYGFRPTVMARPPVGG